MKVAGVRGLFLAAIAGVILCVSPATVSAATQASVVGIIPAGATSCPVVGVSEITPFVYDGHLDSFEVNVTDSSYVAVAAKAGESPVGFQYLTRRINPDGTLRIHVDIASTPLRGDMPITVTLLSSRPDIRVTCALQLSGVVSRGTTVPAPAPTPAPLPVANIPHPNKPVSSGTGSGVSVSNSPHTQSSYSGGKGTITGTVGSTSSTSTIKTPPTKPNTVFVGALHSLGTVCTKASSWKLWAILLVLYFLFVLALALQMPESLSDGSRGWNIVLIIVLLLALLGLWYLSATCRSGPWAPIIAIVLALAGIRALTRKPVAESPVLLIEK